MSFRSTKFKDVRFFSQFIAPTKPDGLKIFVASVDTTIARKKDANENFYQRFFCPFFSLLSRKKGHKLSMYIGNVICSPSSHMGAACKVCSFISCFTTILRPKKRYWNLWQLKRTFNASNRLSCWRWSRHAADNKIHYHINTPWKFSSTHRYLCCERKHFLLLNNPIFVHHFASVTQRLVWGMFPTWRTRKTSISFSLFFCKGRWWKKWKIDPMGTSSRSVSNIDPNQN